MFDPKNLILAVFDWLRYGEFQRRPNVKTAAILLTAMDSAEFMYRQMGKAEAVTDVLGHVCKMASVDGMVLEFGVFTGDSLRVLGAQNPQHECWGFDSFHGMPATFNCYPKGFCDVGGKIPDNLPANVSLVQGWFDETLPGWTPDHVRPVRILHIDCDLYSSTMTVLRHVGPLFVPGTLVSFDEYFNFIGWREHEHKAWVEYCAENAIEFEYLAHDRLRKVAARVISCPNSLIR